MRSITQVVVRVCAVAALAFAGSSCTSTSVQPRLDYGARWPGWKDMDQGGFEQMGTVTWSESEYATSSQDKVVTTVYGSGKHTTKATTAYVKAKRAVSFDFYPADQPFRWWGTPKVRVQLSVRDSVENLIVLDEAASTGGLVHVSGRQRSGLSPKADYVEVTRATNVTLEKPDIW